MDAIKVMAVSVQDGRRREFKSMYDFSKFVGVTGRSVIQAVERGAACKGWLIIESPEKIQERIAELEKRLEFSKEVWGE